MKYSLERFSLIVLFRFVLGSLKGVDIDMPILFALEIINVLMKDLQALLQHP